MTSRPRCVVRCVRIALLASLALGALTLGSCGGNGPADSGIDAGDGGEDASGDADADADGDTDSDADSDTDSDTDGDSGTDGGDAGGDAGPPSCDAAGDLIPGEPIGETTTGADSVIESYSCTALVESGPELAYRYENTSGQLQRLTAELTGMTSDHDLFLLLGACDPAACVAHSASGATAKEEAEALVPAGEQLFVVVDGYAGNSGPFTLEATVEGVESDCADGADDDDDGTTDCGDADCFDQPACAVSCTPGQTFQCGDFGQGQTTGGSAGMEHYAGLDVQLPGPERVFGFSGGGSGMELEVSLTNLDGALYVMVLEGECSTATLLAADTARVLVEPLPATEYHLVVDGADLAGAQFGLALSCREIACDDGLDNDDDGATDCGDPDCGLAPGCVVPCVPLVEDAGCADAGCYLLEPDPLTGFCHAPGDAGAGAPCAAQQDCLSGHVCTPAAICLPGCDLADGEPGCDAGDCHPVGADPLGVCFSADP